MFLNKSKTGGEMMKPKLLFIFTFVVLAAWQLAGCGGGGNQPQNEFTLKVKDEFTYDPSTITVKAGEDFTVTFENNGALEHTFNVLKAGEEIEHVKEDIGDEEHLHEALLFDMHEVPAGGSETATFTAPSEPGEYTFVCVVPGHIDAGMVGTLVVVP
jgi:uncharacterized cupredoxin-like copper-binding protein